MSIALSVKPELCTGCMACVYACSLVHEQAFSPLLSRIRIEKDESLAYSVPVMCLTCEGTPCIDACPAGAIVFDSILHRPAIDASACVGCGACAEACPVGAIRMHGSRGIAFVCDMCSGDPQCVGVCTPGALLLSYGVQTDPAVSGRAKRDEALREIGRVAR